MRVWPVLGRWWWACPSQTASMLPDVWIARAGTSTHCSGGANGVTVSLALTAKITVLNKDEHVGIATEGLMPGITRGRFAGTL